MLLSVIESLRINPELCNFVLNDISTTYHRSRSLLLTARQQQSLTLVSDNDIYTAMILEEAEDLYNNLTTKLTNEIMTAAAIRPSSLLSQPETYNN